MRENVRLATYLGLVTENSKQSMPFIYLNRIAQDFGI
jgi:hypothetical protein